MTAPAEWKTEDSKIETNRDANSYRNQTPENENPVTRWMGARYTAAAVGGRSATGWSRHNIRGSMHNANRQYEDSPSTTRK
uniref:Uncharacterized protein n=1 Tax=Arundo donax TaxID=35708 RepID=A0A0A8ZGE5_ARUDO